MKIDKFPYLRVAGDEDDEEWDDEDDWDEDEEWDEDEGGGEE